MKVAKVVILGIVMTMVMYLIGPAQPAQAQATSVQATAGEGWLALARRCGLPNTMASADVMANANGGGNPQLGKSYVCPGGVGAAQPPPSWVPPPTPIPYVAPSPQTWASPPTAVPYVAPSASINREATCTQMGTAGWFFFDPTYRVTYADGRTSNGFYRPDDGRCSGEVQVNLGAVVGPTGTLESGVTMQQVTPGQPIDPNRVVVFPWVGSFRASLENAKVWMTTQANIATTAIYSLLQGGAFIAIPTAATGSWAIHAGLAAYGGASATAGGALVGVLGGAGLIVVALALISRGAQYALQHPYKGPSPSGCRRTELCLQATCGNREGCRSAMCLGIESTWHIMPHLIFCAPSQ